MIESERLILRLPEPEDLGWNLAHCNTPAVMRHLGGPRSEAAVMESFENNRAALIRGDLGFWTMTLRDSGAPIGKCGLCKIDAPAAPDEIRGAVQIGWTLAEPFWVLGFASEAARAVIGFGFDALDLPVIWSQTSESNAGSTRMMARLGFARCTELDYDDPDYSPQDNPTTVYRMARAATESSGRG